MKQLMFCQCCGSPLSELIDNFGSNSDGSKNTEYCISCFENGELKKTLQSMDQKSQDPIENIVADENLPEDKIGNYRLQQKIGEGGMGDVYVAEQEKPIRRRVAIKIIKHGMDTKEVVARFESERQALALMDHPNIAKVFDAGATELGRPYFVMEYIKGVPITEHCDTHRLNTRERLELFIQVSEGVQHAHQKAIIHRDLKPSNVLVTIQDDKAVPKIIDFGLAKATSQRLTERTMFTEMGQLIGTPEYMSPEQAEMTGQDIDTRTDVYSLGVILYELLVGAQPFDSKELREAGFDGIRRKIREEEPPRPSTRVSTLGQTSTTLAKSRRTDVRGLTSQLKGDLDWITMKALEKDRTRRYGSPHDLAADIGRHLRYETVEAMPPSITYRVHKFVRRHRVGVAASLSLVFLLVAFIVSLTLQTARVTREKDRANREAAAAQQVSEFLVDLFKMSDPSEAKGDTITAREILDRGAERIEKNLNDQPEVQAMLMNTMGQAYQSLGLYDRAKLLLEDALAKRREILGNEHPDVATSVDNLATLSWHQGGYETAETLFREALVMRQRLWGEEHRDVATSLNNLGVLMATRREYEEAELLIRKSLDIRRKLLGNEHPDVAESINNLANVLYNMGKSDSAELLYREGLELDRKLLGDNHPDLAVSLNNLAALLEKKGDLQASESLYSESLDMRRKLFGHEHPAVATVLHNLAFLRYHNGDHEAAEQLYREALNIRRKTLGEEHPLVASTLRHLALLLENKGAYTEAESLYFKTLAIIRKVYGEDHERTLLVLERIVELYETWGKPEKAAEYRSLFSKQRVSR